MNGNKLHKLKNLVMITTGTVVSLAGIAYIAVQYSKLLTTIFMNNEDNEEENKRNSDRLKSQFRQVKTDEGTSPDDLEIDDIELDLSDFD